jgi:hypothetical protein
MDDASHHHSGRPRSAEILNELKCTLEDDLRQGRHGTGETDEIAEVEYLVELIEQHVGDSGFLDPEDICTFLAAELWTYWHRHHSQVALAACVEVQSEILDLHAPGHPQRDVTCVNNATALTARYAQTGDSALLKQAIQLEEEALDLRPAGHPKRATSCASLSVSLRTLFTQTDDSILLDRIVALDQEVLELSPPGHPDRAMACTNLAISLSARHDRIGGSMLLDEVLNLQQEALDLQPAGHPSRATSCTNLAVSLKTRYIQAGDITFLGRAVELEQEALDLRPVGHPDRAASCTNLALSLKLHHSQTGDDVLLEKAIALEQEALSLRPAGHPKRASSCANLAISLKTRYKQTADNTLLDQTMQLEQEALELSPVGHPDRATSCINLASSVYARYSQTKDRAMLEKAITLQQEAFDLHPVGHPDRVLSCANLATLLRVSHDHTREVALLERAIQLSEEALSLSAQGSPQIWRFSLELAKLGQLQLPRPNWDVIISHLHEVLHASSYDDIDLALKDAIPTLLHIAPSPLSRKQQHALLELHADALDVVSVAASLALDTSTQLRHIFHGTTLGLAAFHLAIRLDQPLAGLQLLERARGVLWAQLLHQRDPQLALVPAALATKLQDLVRSSNALGRGADDAALSTHILAPPERSMSYVHRTQLQEVIRQIRALPALSDFMRGPDISTLRDIAAHSHVVVLVADQDKCHALLFASGERTPSYVPLPDATSPSLRDLTFESLAVQRRGAPTPAEGAERGLKVAKGMSAPHVRLAKLWRTIVKPILERLSLAVSTDAHTHPYSWTDTNTQKAQGRARPRIHWCPTGPFAFVPVHAAGIYEGTTKECCADYIVSSYTPTLTALIQARRGQVSYTPQQVNLVTVAVEDAPDSGMPRLRNAVPEARDVLSIAQSAGVSQSVDAAAESKAGVLRILQSSQVVHLACHGIQHRQEPHKSHFCLRTGNLTVSELMTIELKGAFLAFLSACETAKGDKTHTDEAVHLAAAMLFAGFKSVVATMWCVPCRCHPHDIG